MNAISLVLHDGAAPCTEIISQSKVLRTKKPKWKITRELRNISNRTFPSPVKDKSPSNSSRSTFLKGIPKIHAWKYKSIHYAFFNFVSLDESEKKNTSTEHSTLIRVLSFSFCESPKTPVDSQRALKIHSIKKMEENTGEYSGWGKLTNSIGFRILRINWNNEPEREKSQFINLIVTKLFVSFFLCEMFLLNN